MGKPKEEEIKFEEGLKELEDIAERLSAGEMSLDESVKMFERGIELKKICTRKLNQAGKKIKLLMKEADGLKEEDFRIDDNE